MSLTCRKEKGFSHLENTSGNGNGYVINNEERVHHIIKMLKNTPDVNNIKPSDIHIIINATMYTELASHLDPSYGKILTPLSASLQMNMSIL